MLPICSCLLLYLAATSTVTAAAQAADQHVLIAWGDEVRDELKKAEIIPTVLDDFVPAFFLAVEWSSKNAASLGNTIKPKKLQDQPKVTLSVDTGNIYGPGMTYVIAATDPDAPSRDDPKWSEFCHWIAKGVSVSSSSDSLAIADLEDVISYKPPGPPKKTGKHRYVFVALAPLNGTTDPLHLTKPGDRQNWGTGEERRGVREWALENGLGPVAANFIYAQNKKQ